MFHWKDPKPSWKVPGTVIFVIALKSEKMKNKNIPVEGMLERIFERVLIQQNLRYTHKPKPFAGNRELIFQGDL